MQSLENDIKLALIKYPSLKRIGQREIKGIFTASQIETGIQIEDYEVLINFPSRYPFVFPEVKETSNKIPKNVMRHVFTASGNLCFGNFVDTLKICKNGISLLWFLENILNPHLCREYVKEVTGDYPTGERAHSPEGNWESYYEMLKTKDKELILNEIEFALKSTSIKRNHLCHCGSEKKYKQCHLKIKSAILEIGFENAMWLYAYLKNDYETIKL